MSSSMTLFLDARIPVRFGSPDEAGPDDALLTVTDGRGPGAAGGQGVPTVGFCLPEADGAHPAACLCCLPRGPVAEALGRLFLARVRGEVPFFTAVLAVPRDARGEAAIREAVRDDPLLSARYRLTGA